MARRLRGYCAGLRPLRARLRHAFYGEKLEQIPDKLRVAGTGVLAGARQVLIIDEKNLAVCLTDCGDTGIIAGGEKKDVLRKYFLGERFSRMLLVPLYSYRMMAACPFSRIPTILRGVSKE